MVLNYFENDEFKIVDKNGKYSDNKQITPNIEIINNKFSVSVVVNGIIFNVSKDFKKCADGIHNVITNVNAQNKNNLVTNMYFGDARRVLESSETDYYISGPQEVDIIESAEDIEQFVKDKEKGIKTTHNIVKITNNLES